MTRLIEQTVVIVKYRQFYWNKTLNKIVTSYIFPSLLKDQKKLNVEKFYSCNWIPLAGLSIGVHYVGNEFDLLCYSVHFTGDRDGINNRPDRMRCNKCCYIIELWNVSHQIGVSQLIISAHNCNPNYTAHYQGQVIA